MDRANLKVYQHGHTLVLAKNNIDAALIFSAEYGSKFKGRDFRRYRGPFELSYQGERGFSVSERTFIDTVATYAGGIVHESD